jgi:NAD(P)-dependent dehydrogenase (short-subunit alcohol dehydrogenase family)
MEHSLSADDQVEVGPARSVDGATAVVTGAGRGLGRATAVRLAAAGARVVVVEADGPSGRATAEVVGGVYVGADVSDPAAWREIAEHRPTVAVFNAGVAPELRDDYAGVTDEDYARVKGVNLDQTVFGVRSLVPVMRAAGHGRIVTVSSLTGLMAIGDPIYALTKTALLGYVRTVAPILAGDGVAINALCPGVMNTPMGGGGWVEAYRQEGREAEIVTVDAVAEVVHQILTTPGSGRTVVFSRGDRPASTYRFPDIDFRAPGA